MKSVAQGCLAPGEKPGPKERKNIKQLVFTGAKNRGEDDQRRNKLYMAYIKKHIPNVKNIVDDGSEIRVDI